MQRFVKAPIASHFRALLQDPLTILRPAVIGGTVQTVLQNSPFELKTRTTCTTHLFNQPTRSMKIYTGTGDKGTSSLFTGERRPKTDAAFHALGTVDELSCAIAMALAQIELYLDKTIQPGYNLRETCKQLDIIQRRLQAVGSSVATPIPTVIDPTAAKDGDSETRRSRYAHVNFPEEAASVELEAWIDAMTATLPPLRQFVLPSGGPPGTALHFARAICRRAERCIVALNAEEVVVEAAVIIYMNRLSDYLFTAGRYVACGLNFADKPYTISRPSKKQ